MSIKTTLLKAGIPIVIIFVGVIIMKTLISSRPAPERDVNNNNPGILVEVVRVEKKNAEVVVKGTGTVEPSQEVSVIPEVSGRVRTTGPNLVVGGFFEKDSILFEIDDTDYRLALERALSAGAKAEFELATIESQAQVARTEWEQLNKDNDIPPNPLVLYEPQLKSARAALASASAGVEQAMIDLERTKVKVPFNARVRSENIDTGQYVRAGTSVAVLAGTDRAEIAVPLPLEELQWINVPRHGKRQNGADASVHLPIGGKTYQWDGRVMRSTGEVDPRSRMIHLIVEVRDPYGLKRKSGPSRPPLAAGSFVEVHIRGKMLKDVIIIPRTALRDGATVWVMDDGNRLLINKVAVLRMDGDTVIIGEGINDGEMVVTSNITGAADGMYLRASK